VCGLLKKWAYIQREHYRQLTQCRNSQGSKQPKHYQSRCSTKCTAKKCKCSSNFESSTRELRIPSTEVCIPLKKYHYACSWACSSKWKNCRYLHHIVQSVRTSQSHISKVQYQRYNVLHKTMPSMIMSLILPWKKRNLSCKKS